MFHVPELRAESAGRRDDYLPHIVNERSRAGRRNRLADELPGAIGLLVLCAISLLLMLAAIRVEYRLPTEGRPTATESEALSKALYARQR
jgi:hypothetical protein